MLPVASHVQFGSALLFAPHALKQGAVINACVRDFDAPLESLFGAFSVRGPRLGES